MIFTMRWWYVQWNNDIYDEELILFTDEMRNNDIYILDKFWAFTSFPSPLITKNPNYEFFLWCLKTSVWRRFCCRVGTPTPPPGVLFWHGHKQLTMRLMVPLCSLQPGTGIPAWCPQFEFWGVAYGLVCQPLELEWQLEEQTQWPGLQDLRPRVLWTLEAAAGKWGNWGLGRVIVKVVGKGEGGNTRWLPSGVHRSLLPQIPLQPPWTFPIPVVSSCCASASSFRASSHFWLTWWSNLNP